MESKTLKVAVLAGDGVGPEVMKSAVSVAQCLGGKYSVNLLFHEFPYSADYYINSGEKEVPDSIFQDWPARFDAVLLGAFGDPRVPSAYAETILLGIRRRLDLYVNFRPITVIDAGLSPLKKSFPGMSIAVFRENTEGLYCGSGGILKPDTHDAVAIENSINSFKGIERIIKASFDYARLHRCKSVVMVDKSNVLKYEGALWQKAFADVGSQFPDVEGRHMYIDRACMELLKNPSQFEVIVTSNLFGDIISDLTAQIQGGLGLAPSANYNPEQTDFMGLFEPVHGSAPDIAGQGIANPLGAISSVALLFDRCGFQSIASELRRTLETCILGRFVTPDLGGTYSTDQVTEKIIELLR